MNSRPAISASPGNLLEIQILRSHPDLLNQNTIRDLPYSIGDFITRLGFYNHSPRLDTWHDDPVHAVYEVLENFYREND